MIDWIHAGPALTAAFLASLVECVEAATIVLAVGTVRGWRSALVGMAAGLRLLIALVGVLGPPLRIVSLSPHSPVFGALLSPFVPCRLCLAWLPPGRVLLPPAAGPGVAAPYT